MEKIKDIEDAYEFVLLSCQDKISPQSNETDTKETVTVGKWYKHGAYNGIDGYYKYRVTSLIEENEGIEVDNLVSNNKHYEKHQKFEYINHSTPAELTLSELQNHLKNIEKHTEEEGKDIDESLLVILTTSEFYNKELCDVLRDIVLNSCCTPKEAKALILVSTDYKRASELIKRLFKNGFSFKEVLKVVTSLD